MFTHWDKSCTILTPQKPCVIFAFHPFLGLVSCVPLTLACSSVCTQWRVFKHASTDLWTSEYTIGPDWSTYSLLLSLTAVKCIVGYLAVTCEAYDFKWAEQVHVWNLEDARLYTYLELGECLGGNRVPMLNGYNDTFHIYPHQRL